MVTPKRCWEQFWLDLGETFMIVIVDERETVLDGYTAWFCREGVSATGLAPQDFRQWVNTAPEPDIDAVEAFLLGDFQNSGGSAGQNQIAFGRGRHRNE